VVSGDDGDSPKDPATPAAREGQGEGLTDTIALASTLKITNEPGIADTLVTEPPTFAETLKIAEAPKITEAPKIAEAPFRRRKNKERLRENVVRSRVSVPPPRWITPAKPPTMGVTLRQVSRVCFVMALLGYLLLAYLRMRTVAEVNRAVQRSTTKTTNTL
jgi:hypothetical protein